MSRSPSDATTEPLDPGARVHGLVALVLRAGLGVQLLNAGMTGFHYAQYVQNSPRFGGGAFEIFGIYPGTELIYSFLPYFQMILGLALILGFLTTIAATAAALLIVFPGLAQAWVLLTIGLGLDPYRAGNAAVQSALNGATSLTLIHCAAVLWLSGTATNSWSLDRMMFRCGNHAERGRVRARLRALAGGRGTTTFDHAPPPPSPSVANDRAGATSPGGDRP